MPFSLTALSVIEKRFPVLLQRIVLVGVSLTVPRTRSPVPDQRCVALAAGDVVAVAAVPGAAPAASSTAGEAATPTSTTEATTKPSKRTCL